MPNNLKMQAQSPIPAHLKRARRTAALARGAMSLCGIALVLGDPGLAPHRTLALIAFAFIAATSVLQYLWLESPTLKLEESLAVAAVLIVGMGEEHVTVLSLLWLGAVAAGVLARGGRVHWVGRTLVLGSLALPVLLTERLTLAHAAFSVATIALLLTCGRVTQELRALLASARFDADHDSLTGVLSRAAFRARLDSLVKQTVSEPTQTGPGQRSLAVLLIDLDSFGTVNKLSGHAAGDALLTRVADVLCERASSDPSGLIGRLGGDEFGLTVYDEDPEALARELTCDLAAATDPVTACIGVAAIPGDGHSADTLLRAADIALRVAKRGGRGHVSAYAGGSLSDEGPQGARSALLRLIRGEGLSIFVQPIVDITTGRHHAYEALARFQAGATSSPLHWFALADEFGMRPELELACLKAALELLEELPGQARLSVNLSGAMLLDPRTLALLLDAPDLSRLVVELTENTLVEDIPEVHRTIAALREEGVELAIDDMGAGYSGLRQITTVHARYLKLDRSLVTDIHTSRERQALVAALVGYAQQMNGSIVAEGVETEPELEAVRGLGVCLVQGYLLGRPAPPWPESSAAAEWSVVGASDSDRVPERP